MSPMLSSKTKANAVREMLLSMTRSPLLTEALHQFTADCEGYGPCNKCGKRVTVKEGLKFQSVLVCIPCAEADEFLSQFLA